ncbi:hypothetical protein CCP3SC1AL1_1590002 [Gammaproteobacteria bacterium]
MGSLAVIAAITASLDAPIVRTEPTATGAGGTAFNFVVMASSLVLVAVNVASLASIETSVPVPPAVEGLTEPIEELLYVFEVTLVTFPLASVEY